MQIAKPVKSPRKQRKRLYNAPAHIRHRLMAAPLSPQLAISKSVKTLPVRKGDTVRVMRGDNKGFEGKISRLDLKKYRIYIEGLTREKVDGTTVFVPIHPSKVMIKNLNLGDKWRKAIVERKETLHKEAKAAVKPAKVTKETTKTKPHVTEKTEVTKETAEAKSPKETTPATKVPIVEEKVKKAALEAKTTTAQTKPRKKPVAKKKEAKTTEENQQTEKKPKTAETNKKTRTKRKAIKETKEGGT